MAKSSYLPSSDNDFLAWLNHFIAHLAEQQATLGLPAEDAAAISAGQANLNDKIAALNHAAALAKQATGEKNLARREIETQVRAVVRRIKADSKYTPSLGMLLGIEGSEDTTDLSVSKPTLSALDLGGGKVELSFNKNKSDGVNIYGKREGDADFVFLGRDLTSPFIDSRPLLTPGKPEIRYFKAVYVIGDDEVGQFSDVVMVNCTP